MIRVAVIGSTGQLGSELVQRLEHLEEYAVTPLSHDDIECAEFRSVRAVLRDIRPDVVINAAGYVRVDESEERPEEAFRVNAIGALCVAKNCAELGALNVYVSTDYVFRGEKEDAYTEDDAPCPVNVYGVSKLAGEHLTRQASDNWLIVRLASLFGKSGARGKGGNFIETVVNKARRGEMLRVVTDTHMSPVYAVDAALAFERLIHLRATGVYHVSNGGSCSWYEFARRVLDLTGLGSGVEPISSMEYPAKARRPRNSALTSSRLPGELKEIMRPWQDALRAYLVERGHIAQ